MNILYLFLCIYFYPSLCCEFLCVGNACHLVGASLPYLCLVLFLFNRAIVLSIVSSHVPTHHPGHLTDHEIIAMNKTIWIANRLFMVAYTGDIKKKNSDDYSTDYTKYTGVIGDVVEPSKATRRINRG